MGIIAQVAGAIATLTNVIGIQLKTKKQILLSYVIAEIFFIISFGCLKAYSGVATCAIMMFVTALMYFMDKYKKEVKTWLVIVLMILSLGIAFLFYHTWVDLISIIACIPFLLMSVQKKEKYVRIYTFIFLLFYTTYDILVGAYTAFIGDLLFTISTIISIIRYDILKKKERQE